MKHIVKDQYTTLGFVYQDNNDQWWYVFGKPSQPSYISFACANSDDGIDKIRSNTRGIK